MKRFIKDPDPKFPGRLLVVHDDGTRKGGYWAVDPAGHVVALELTAKVKPGWRLATPTDLDAKIAAEAERQPKPPAPPAGKAAGKPAA